MISNNQLNSLQQRKPFMFLYFVAAGGFVVITAALGWIMLGHLESQARERALNDLQNLLSKEQVELQQLVRPRKAVAMQLASDPKALSLMKEQLEAAVGGKEALLKNRALSELNGFFTSKMIGQAFDDYFIIAPNHTVVASLEEAAIGEPHPISLQKNRRLQDAFEGKVSLISNIRWERAVVSRRETFQRPTLMFLVAPIRDESAKTLATLAFRIGPGLTSNIAQPNYTNPESSEIGVYLFDETGVLLRDSRNEEQRRRSARNAPEAGSVETPEAARVRNDPWERSFSQQMAESISPGEKDSAIKAYRTSQSIPAYGAWLWDEELDIGLAAEISVSRALESVSNTRNLFLVIFAATCFLALALAFLIARVRKLSEKQLQTLASIVQNADEMIVIANPEGIVEYVNPSYERTLGVSLEEARGKKAAILFKETEDSEFHRGIWDGLRRGKSWEGTLTDCIKNGEAIKFDSILSPIYEKEDVLAGFVFLLRDVSEKARLEEMLRQSEKMQAIGTLAGGIAHDFNNILAGIQGHAELVLNALGPSSAISEDAQEILTASKRGADLVSQILSISRKREEKWERVDIKEVISASLRLLKYAIPSSIKLQQSFQTENAIVYSDQTRLQQVLINLYSNAVAAIGNNTGTIEIGLSDCDAGPLFAEKHALPAPGTYLKLTIRDSGSGIEPEILHRIFEPFFTTKEMGQGTGIGLAQVHSIIESHKGSIEVESAPGEGALFTIFLPKAADQANLDKKTPEVFPTTKGNERILIVDDESMVATFFSRALTQKGYDTTVFNDPLEALATFKARSQDFDLVITDQNMPGMKGDELLRNLLQIDPKLPVILCSGYTGALEESEIQEIGISHFLMKPISAQDLAKAVREALDRRHQRA